VAGHSVKRGGESIALTPLEFDLLVALAPQALAGVQPAKVLPRAGLGLPATPPTPGCVNVHVQRLRSKIEHDPEKPEIVITVRGVGYKAGPA